jgi:D-alanyl-D-alanine carboxypeptidase
MKMRRNKSIAISICIIALVAIFFVSKNVVPEQVLKKDEPVFHNPFATTSVEAKGVFVYNPISDLVMFQRNSNEAFPLASVTKIMTAHVASKFFSDNDIITIEYSDLAPEGDGGINPGEDWRFKDLRDIMLVASSNDAAEAVRRATDEKLSLVGASTTIGIMNETADTLGLKTLLFKSVTGLDINDNEATAFGSAHDIAFAFAYIIHANPEMFESTRESSIVRGPINGNVKVFKNTNITINDLPSLIASKTGYTDTAGGNLIAAFDAGIGSPIIIAVLGSKDQETRFDDMLQLAEKAVRYTNGTYYSGL